MWSIFDPINIISAVKSAFADLDKKIGPQEERLIRDIANQVEAEIKDRYNGPAKIEDIQNLVEHGLIEDHLYDVARTYTNYRLNKDIERAKATDINEAVKRLVNRDEALVRENANKDSNVYSTQRDLLAGAVSKASAFSMLPDAVSNAHMKGDIHFHDADYSPFTAQSNCSLPNYWDMLANGFTLGNAPMGSPNSISIAATQITQIMKDVASSQYGGQTANRADEHFAEYAKKDYDKFLEQAHEIMPDDLPIEIAERQVRMAKAVEPKRLHFEKDRPALPMDEPFDKTSDRLQQLREIWAKIQTRKAIYDAMQTMEYQINSNRVSNGQTPFVTVGFGLGTDWFAREIQRAIFLNRIRGLGSEHHTAIFPKLVFTIKHGVNADPGDPNYDLKQLALECATKRMYPDVIFYENIVKITGSFKAPMGCRSFLQGWIDPKTGKDVEDGRMNLGVVTVNIPRIALESHGDKDRFWKIFDERMAVAHQALQFRIMRCKQATPVNAPTLFRFGAFGRLGANDSVDQLFRNERATVSLGYIGLYEATSVFYGKDWMRDHDWDPEGKGIRTVHRQAHERAVQGLEHRGRLPLLRVLHAGRIAHRPLQPHGPREVRRSGRRHRPRLLHQLLPLPGVAAAHADGEARLREGLPVLRFRRLHQLLRIPVPAGQSEGARSGVGLRLHHRHRLSRHEHANRPLLRMRFRR